MKNFLDLVKGETTDGSNSIKDSVLLLKCILKAGGALDSIGRQIPGVELVHNISEAEEAVMKLVGEARKGWKITLSHDYWEKVRPYSCEKQAKWLSDFLRGFVQAG